MLPGQAERDAHWEALLRAREAYDARKRERAATGEDIHIEITDYATNEEDNHRRAVEDCLLALKSSYNAATSPELKAAIHKAARVIADRNGFAY